MRILALILTAFTGFTGLVYEVTWQKYLATLLGSHSEATAAVLGIFLGGLSLGYSLFGRVTRELVTRAEEAGRKPRLLAVYGGVEAAIGVYALVFPWLFWAAEAVAVALAPENAVAVFLLNVILAALLIGPASVLMGGTIPMLTQALTRNLEEATRFHALVYGTNTLGAFAGALSAGFWLIPQLGLVGVLRWSALVNLAAGAIFFAFDRFAPTLAESAARETTPEAPELRPYLAAAFLIGFGMMTIQTILIRVGGLALGSSHFTFSMVVAVFVLCIALGSFAVAPLRRIATAGMVANLWTLVALLALLYTVLPDTPFWAHRLRLLFRDDAGAFPAYYFMVFCATVALIGLPILLSGAALPLLFHHLRQRFGELGATAGSLYSWNTLGSLAGALGGGYLLLFWIDLDHAFRVAVAAIALAAALLTLRIPRASWATAGPALGAALLALLLLPQWPVERLASGLFRERVVRDFPYTSADDFYAAYAETLDFTYPFHTDDPAASVAVRGFLDGESNRTYSILVNGKSDGAINADYPTMALLSLLPAALAENPERGFIVGYGTGVSTGELANLDSIREVVVAEISRGVMQAASFFEDDNLGASTNAKVRVVYSDAYRVLLSSHEPFDVIVSEPSNPWVTGVEMLYSREFLEAARSRLREGGVYAQWLHTYETDSETIELILRTFLTVFPESSIWFGVGSDLIVLGFKPPIGDLAARFESRLSQPDFSAGLDRAGISGLYGVLAHEILPLGVPAAMALEGPIHTLLRPILSDHAARAFYAGKSGRLPKTAHRATAIPGAENSLLLDILRSRATPLTVSERRNLTLETCFHRPSECVALLGQWRRVAPPFDPDLEEAIGLALTRPHVESVMSPEILQVIDALYDPDPPRPKRAAALQDARAATDYFEFYYHHGAPFFRSSVDRMWDHCESYPEIRERCARDRERSVERLGDLSSEPAVLPPVDPRDQ